MLLIKDFAKCVYFFKKLNNEFKLFKSDNTDYIKYRLTLKLDSYAFLSFKYFKKSFPPELMIFNDSINQLSLIDSIFKRFNLKEITNNYNLFLEYFNKSNQLKKDLYIMMNNVNSLLIKPKL